MWVAVVMQWPRERIQLSLQSSCWTVLFFLLANWKRFGAKYLGASPSSQLLCQKLAFTPSPMVTMVEALNNSRSTWLQGRSIPVHGLDSSVHSCHSQRSRSAWPSLSRSGTPSPSRSFGRATVGQFTKQCPPFAFSSPFHKNDLLTVR